MAVLPGRSRQGREKSKATEPSSKGGVSSSEIQSFKARYARARSLKAKAKLLEELDAKIQSGS